MKTVSIKYNDGTEEGFKNIEEVKFNSVEKTLQLIGPSKESYASVFLDNAKYFLVIEVETAVATQ